MLKGTLYYITNLKVTEDKIEVQLSFNPAHAIFGGHFPARPVVPGVCLMQIVKEVLEEATARKLQLNKADYLKFITPVVPVEAEVLELKIKYSAIGEQGVKVAAVLSKTAVYFKFQGIFNSAK